jgi:uncharacterized membrane protein HdeD (DUF308 family)
MNDVSDVLTGGLAKVRRSRRLFFVLGILLTILGVVCIVKARTATTMSVAALGWIIGISSVFWLFTAFQAFGWRGVFSYLLNAIFRGLTGCFLISHPGAGAAGVASGLAMLFILGGLFRIASASVIRFPKWGWTAVAGFVSMALGAYLLATWDTASTSFLGIAIGIDLIFDSAALIHATDAIHCLPKPPRTQSQPAESALSHGIEDTGGEEQQVRVPRPHILT